MSLKIKVIVSDPISDEGLDIFKQNDIEIIDATNIAIDDNYEHIASANGWVIRSGTTLDSSIIKKANSLSVIGRAGVGIDNIDISAATRKGVVVMNTPDANTISAAEHTLALLLSLSRIPSSLGRLHHHHRRPGSASTSTAAIAAVMAAAVLRGWR